MSDIGEAIGTAAEGSLFAKAIDGSKGPAPNRDKSGHFAENACLNCGTVLTGNHCHECGQKAHLHRTLGAFMHDLLHGALHFEGKTWRTLPELALRPGKLTRRYIEGERARFVSPMALFLFSIFLMFAVFQAAGISAPTDIDGDSILGSGTSSAKIQAMEARTAIVARLDAQPQSTSEERSALEERLTSLDNALVAIDQGENFEFEDEDGNKVAMTVGGTGIRWLDKGLQKWRTNPSLMLYKMQTNSYKFSWLLIPLSIPFVWLLFAWKRQFRAYDHAIFVTYSLAFMSLLFIVASVLGLIGLPAQWLVPAVLIVPPIHIYKQLRGAYSLSRFSAFWRLCFLTIFIVLILSLFLNILLLLGAI